MIRYRVENVPDAGMGAFMPGLTRPGWASSVGLATAGIVGFPGTDPVPVENTHHLSDLGWQPGGKTQGSNNAPDIITPAVYIPGTINMGPWSPRGAAHIQQSDQVLPVPAGDYGPAAIPVFRPAAVGAGDTAWAGQQPQPIAPQTGTITVAGIPS